MPNWDVFVSYDRADAAAVGRIADALAKAGLRVFLDTTHLRQFGSIPDGVRTALSGSRLLLAYYSRSYGTRAACQEEFTTAFLAGPERVLVVNPEAGTEHLHPRRVLDVLLPGHPATSTALEALVAAVGKQVEDTDGTIGLAPSPERLTGPGKFAGRWAELWQLHDVLSHGGTAVVHGVIGIGKTSLAREYVQLFGRTYATVRWNEPNGEGADLVVLDDVTAPLHGSADGVACLVLTRDQRLAAAGAGIELTDLREHELPLAASLRGTAEGSTGLARALVEQFSGSEATMLDRLHGLRSPLLEPVIERVAPAVDQLGEPAWDALRICWSAAPAPLTAALLADVLSEVDGGTRGERFGAVEEVVTGLVTAGVLAGALPGEQFVLPKSFQLALRRADPRPARTERLREAALGVLADRARPGHGVVRARIRSTLDDEERRAAHHLLNELTSRVPFRELPAGEGLLRSALSSLHTLFDRIRQVGNAADPDALRLSTPVRPGLATLIRRLQNEILGPFLTYWHTRLDQHHELRPPGIGSRDHELAWELHGQLRAELGKVRLSLAEVAEELAVLSGNPLR
ncbi:toll/interleukin-1 receptor domain-containing protein [Amycolatopsis jiangsuensis]|uniref:AcrR family transcriptional regulator n=1 Tax=Amycolatopsis jiangsuensis TaxID=1181879 RepID=A0A840IX26_9PSEU|nr:toll/interleukin-1 receptor domain-containing protein [Amycolatopsis jiangsuensis]MBB4687156.1 AcrR family transcriptional regulator [Amycolatopsis jiangsuensis]